MFDFREHKNAVRGGGRTATVTTYTADTAYNAYTGYTAKWLH